MAYDVTRADGICVLVGVPVENVTIDTLPLHFNKVLTGSEGGGSAPNLQFPFFGLAHRRATQQNPIDRSPTNRALTVKPAEDKRTRQDRRSGRPLLRPEVGVTLRG